MLQKLFEIIRFQTLVFLSFTPFVYSSLQRAFWEGFSNTATRLPHVFLMSCASAPQTLVQQRLASHLKPGTGDFRC